MMTQQGIERKFDEVLASMAVGASMLGNATEPNPKATFVKAWSYLQDKNFADEVIIPKAKNIACLCHYQYPANNFKAKLFLIFDIDVSAEEPQYVPMPHGASPGIPRTLVINEDDKPTESKAAKTTK